MPNEPSWWYRPSGATARLLSPPAAVYGAIVSRRMSEGPRYRSRLPVICVGNFTAGGAGKTPVTAMIARRLIGIGQRPAILTRGYGGRERGPWWVDATADTADHVGDEPLLHARIAPTLVARDRVAGACEIERDGTATVIVMDDGLQNPHLAKTLGIAVVDGARGVGNGRVIPAGPLRAPLAVQLAHIGAIIVNGPASAGTASWLGSIGGAGAHGASVPILCGDLVPDTAAAALAGQRVVAFAGIGNPERFFATVRDLGAVVAEAVPYPDHHAFSARDAEHLLAASARLGGACLVTTEKDFVRMSGRPTLAGLAAESIAIPVEMRLDAASDRVLDRLLGFQQVAGKVF